MGHAFTLNGTFMHTPTYGATQVLEDALVVVEDGVIEAVVPRDAVDWHATRGAAKDLIALDPADIVLPGLVDTHVHAPQWPQLGTALHLPLETWLHEKTFPLEARYADQAFARLVYDDLVSTLLANGTTTAVYYGTIHNDANKILVDACISKGQRALVGKVAMDHPDECPDYYRDVDADSALAETREFIHWVRAHPRNADALVEPVVTPRFIPSCTDALLEGLGAIADEMNCPVQTHCSESDWEHNYVINRLGKTDTQALDDFSLLTPRSILAHANFISPTDVATIVRRRAGVSHCPLSNQYFAGSVFPLRSHIAHGLTVGLGTDIAGGPSASMLHACRHAVSASRSLDAGVDPDKDNEARGRPFSAIDFRHAFWLATAGGGELLDLPIGRFAPGFQFDAMQVNTRRQSSNIRYNADLETLDDLFQKIVYGAERLDIRRVWVSGREVVTSDSRGREVVSSDTRG